MSLIVEIDVVGSVEISFYHIFYFITWGGTSARLINVAGLGRTADQAYQREREAKKKTLYMYTRLVRYIVIVVRNVTSYYFRKYCGREKINKQKKLRWLYYSVRKLFICDAFVIPFEMTFLEIQSSRDKEAPPCKYLEKSASLSRLPLYRTPQTVGEVYTRINATRKSSSTYIRYV